MRLWSLHPQYLDPQGLVALWREALLAKAVLSGQTRGYRNHPQLERFKAHPHPLPAISLYLQAVHAEATRRHYTFDRSKFETDAQAAPLVVSSGQLDYEWQHLMHKLKTRSPALFQKWQGTPQVQPHPLFTVQAGAVASWERA